VGKDFERNRRDLQLLSSNLLAGTEENDDNPVKVAFCGPRFKLSTSPELYLNTDLLCFATAHHNGKRML
jgi:hypothetical protein